MRLKFGLVLLPPLLTLAMAAALPVAALPLAAAQKAIALDPEVDITLTLRKGNLQVEVPEGAHLKAEFMEVKLAKGTSGTLKAGPLPPTREQDELGDGIWHGMVKIPLKGEGLSGQVGLQVCYQPCTEGKGGVCFPPITRTLTVKASEIPSIGPKETAPRPTPEGQHQATQAPVHPATTPSPVHAAASPNAPSKSLLWIFLSVFAAGMLASLTPCVFPMIPVILAIIGAKGAGKGRTLVLTGMLVIGMATTYSSLGVIAAKVGATAGSLTQRATFLIPVSSLFLLFAMSMFGAFEIQLPEAIRSRLQGTASKGGMLGAFLLGMVLGPISAPCVGPIIGAVLLAIGQEGKLLLGALQLFTFALGMGVLFMTVGLFSSLLPKSGYWLLKVKQVAGTLILAFAAWNIRLVVPLWANYAMSSAVLFCWGFVFEAFAPAEELRTYIRKGIGLFAITLSLLTATRATEILAGLQLLPRASSEQPQTASIWMDQDLEGALVRAKTEHKLVLLDTYAEWCAQCKELDEKTWPDEGVKAWITTHAVAVRVDADKIRPDLAKRYGIAGFPTVLVLDSDGKELRRSMGFQSPETMLAFLKN